MQRAWRQPEAARLSGARRNELDRLVVACEDGRAQRRERDRVAMPQMAWAAISGGAARSAAGQTMRAERAARELERAVVPGDARAPNDINDLRARACARV